MLLKNRVWFKRVVSVVLLAFMLSASCTNVFAYTTKTTVTQGDTSSPGSILVERMELKDSDDKVIGIQRERDFQTSINELTTEESGTIAASKTGFFEDGYDAKDGIVKLVFDIVGTPSSPPVDVLFVLDESGSMNMYAEDDYIGHTDKPYYFQQHTVPCMNPNHYYKVKFYYNNDRSKMYDYDFIPADITELNVWTNRDFYTAIKQRIAEDPAYQALGITESSKITFDGFDGSYNFAAYHYYKDDTGNNIPIAPSGNHNYNLSNASGGYYSPPYGNEAGCIDRLLTAKQALKDMSGSIIRNNDESRIAYISFAGEVIETSEFTHSVPTQLDHLNGYDYTRYSLALYEAYEMLTNNPPTDGRKRYVVFITDGKPDDDRNKVQEAANQILKLDNVTMYCVGISSGQSELLRTMSTGGEHFKDCTTSKDFLEYMDIITAAVNAGASMLVDVLGEAYNMLVDADHPITVQTGTQPEDIITYSTLEDAKVAGIDYDADNAKLTWSMSNVSATGARLSFYIKLDSNATSESSADGTYEFPTNKEATITYKPVINGETAEKEVTLDLPFPGQIVIEQSKLVATKSSNKPNAALKPEDEITYTIEIENPGAFSLEGTLIVWDDIPDGTEFVRFDMANSTDCSHNKADNRVEYTVGDYIGGPLVVSFSYTVKVIDGPKNIENHAKFGLDSTDTSESINTSGEPLCCTNTVINPRLFLLTISKIVKGDLADPLKKFTFTINLDGADVGENIPLGDVVPPGYFDSAELPLVNGSTTIELSHGQAISLYIPNGTTYSITENSDGYIADPENGYGDTTISADVTAEFINEKHSTPPTGIMLDIFPYLLIIILIAVAVIVIIICKSRKVHKNSRRQDNGGL